MSHSETSPSGAVVHKATFAAAPLTNGRATQTTMVEQSRAIAEVQAAVVVAQNRPRDRSYAMQEMREVCAIPALAEMAFFRLPRGGETVSGETVHLARELARIWGNVVYGVKELSRDEDHRQSEMLAYAWDLQTNDRAEIGFIVPHQRDKRGGPVPLTSMSDIYENNANAGARRLRECIFSVLPVWFKAEAVEICRATLETGGGKPLVARVTDCVTAFEGIGVTRSQIERHRGRKIEDLTAEDVATLGVVFKSIKRGEVPRDDEFPREEVAEKPVASKLDALEKASVGKKSDKDAAPADDFPGIVTPKEQQP